MTRAPLKDLRQGQRALRASITSLRQAIHRARYRDVLELEVAKLEKSAAELGRRIAAEQAALDEPHAFLRPPWGIWCLRCGGTADRPDLHPQAQAIANHEGAAAAAGRS